MKSFRDYISEEVVPTARVKDGSIDLDKEEVRASINMALAKVTSDSSITPYIALNHISKALAMFHIILPKRVYLEGAKGVEVHEIRQFGQRMGMTDSGEFVNEVPGKYFLFIQYGMNTPMNSGGQYAYPTMGGTFRVTARVVDPIELNRLLDVAEISIAEECNAETQQLKAKMLALKEPMKDLATDGSPSTDTGVATSERKSNKKLSAGSLDEASVEKLIRYRNKAEKESMRHAAAATMRQPGLTLADKKLKGKAKVNATAPKHPYMEETLDETHADNIRRKYRQKEDDNDHTGNVHLLTRVFGSKKERETSKGLLQKRNKQGYVTGSDSEKGYKMTKDYARRMEKLKEEELAEKAPPGAKFERMVKHIKKGYSKDGLTKKEKSIAYATAWKAKNRQDEELKFDPSTEIPKNS